jgi:hypothetical protein
MRVSEERSVSTSSSTGILPDPHTSRDIAHKLGVFPRITDAN